MTGLDWPCPTGVDFHKTPSLGDHFVGMNSVVVNVASIPRNPGQLSPGTTHKNKLAIDRNRADIKDAF
jgi:hypothetical protein